MLYSKNVILTDDMEAKCYYTIQIDDVVMYM